MKLLEYEAKTLLKAAGLPVPQSTIIASPDTPISAPVVLKSQVPTGGRGKLGGVVIVETEKDVQPTLQNLFARTIKGFRPHVLLAEEKIAIKKEYYLSILIDQATATIRIIAHKEGGIEVEANDTQDFFNETISAASVIDTTKKLATYLECNPTLLHPFIQKLFDAFTGNDATLIEINPLILTVDDQLMCGDCKMELDDAAAFRHPDWHFEDTPQNANFVILHDDGTVATIANGAGLAMATVDAVAAKNMKPANFLDIGGGATAESIVDAFNKIVEFPNVKTIVINIFAGITRCDEVAKAIIEAKKQIPHLPPLFIRLAGTNFEEAKVLLAAEDIPTLASLDECLNEAKEVVYA
jgi:succinyl-CoA synthetase beta subunit